MPGSKILGRVLFLSLGYLAGTRAGRERYAQIEAGAKAEKGWWSSGLGVTTWPRMLRGQALSVGLAV